MSKNNDENMGTIVSYFGNSVAVEDALGQVFQCHLYRNQPQPVVGDRVRFQWETGSTGRIESIEKRRSLFARGDKRGVLKPIAANVDVIVIVMAPPPVFSNYLIDRYFIAASLLTIPAILVINKMDLLDERDKEELEKKLSPYRAIYPVILSTIMTREGLKALGEFLKDKTSVLIGPSGVGKSSIIAALSNDKFIRIGEVSHKGAGKHTTTATRLYHLPNGGNVIDSPGVREFNLWSVSHQEIVAGFTEFAPYIKQCKFRDCAHLIEPGCAVKAALQTGKISHERYESFKKMTQKMV